MEPIAPFAEDCRQLTREAFLARYPHPFLVHSSLDARPLKPIGATHGLTVDRLVLEETRGSEVPASLLDSFAVFRVRSPNGPCVTVGCSPTADVRIDDVSVSELHAFIVQRGDAHFLVDNDSSAGSQVNGAATVSGKATRLTAGDRLTLGFVQLVFLPSADFHAFLKRVCGV